MRFFLTLTILLVGCSQVLDLDSECTRDSDCRSDLVCQENLCIFRPTAPANCRTVYGVEPEAIFDPLVIRFGMLMPTSGDLGPVGQAMERAVGLAATEINQNGGIDGRRFGLIACDSGSDPQTALAGAQWLIDGAGVPAIIGPARSTVTLEVFNEVAHPNEVLLMSPSATSPAITDVRDDDLLWRTVPTDDFQGFAIFGLIQQRRYEKVAILNLDDTYGNGLRSLIQTSLCEAGPCDDSVVLSRRFLVENDGQNSDQWPQIVGQLQSFNPDVIVFIGFVESGISFLRHVASSETLRNTPVICTDGMSDKKVVEEISDENGAVVLSNIVGTRPATPTGEVFRNFSISYSSKWNEQPGVYNANAYDAMYLLAFAAGGVEPGLELTGPRLAEQLRRVSEGNSISASQNNWGPGLAIMRSAGEGMDFDGASGPLDFDANGEATSSIEAWYFDVGNGRVASHGVLLSAEGQYVPLEEDSGE